MLEQAGRLGVLRSCDDVLHCLAIPHSGQKQTKKTRIARSLLPWDRSIRSKRGRAFGFASVSSGGKWSRICRSRSWKVQHPELHHGFQMSASLASKTGCLTTGLVAKIGETSSLRWKSIATLQDSEGILMPRSVHEHESPGLRVRCPSTLFPSSRKYSRKRVVISSSSRLHFKNSKGRSINIRLQGRLAVNAQSSAPTGLLLHENEQDHSRQRGAQQAGADAFELCQSCESTSPLPRPSMCRSLCGNTMPTNFLRWSSQFVLKVNMYRIMCISIHLSIYLFIHLSIYLSIYLSTSLCI